MAEKLGKVISLIKLSRKYTFALIGLVFSVMVLCVVHRLGFSDGVAKCAIISCEAVILIVTITFLTGQAKIDLTAVYGNHSQSPVSPSPINRLVATIQPKE